MSSWDPQNPYRDFPEHFQHQPRGGSRVFVAVVVIVGVVACIVIGLGFVFYQAVKDNVADNPTDDSQKTLEQKQAELVAGFGSDEQGVSDDEWIRVTQLLDEVVAATSANDEDAFCKCVDFGRHYQEIANSKHAPYLNYADRLSITRDLRDVTSVPAFWARYRLTHVQLLEGGQEAIAYTHFWPEGQNAMQVRFWITKSNEQWKLYDWEIVEYGLRTSSEWAIYIAEQGSFRMDKYFEARDTVAAADQLIADGDYAAAAEKIREAEKYVVLPKLKDDITLQIAFAWSRCGRYNEMLKACQRIESPQSVPGAWYGMAMAYQDLGQHDKVVEFSTKYEQICGRSVPICQMKAESLQQLGRPVESAAEWRKLLAVDPNNDNALKTFGQVLPDDEKESLVPYVARLEDATEVAAELAAHFSIYGESELIGHLGNLIRKRAPNSASAKYVEALAAECVDDNEKAAALLRQAFEFADEENRSTYVQHYLDTMVALDKTVEGYQATPDAKDAFSYLGYSYEDGDLEISDETMQQLIAAHRVREPKDPWANYYAGQILLRRKQYAEAEQEFAAGMANAEDDDTRDSLRYQRVSAMFEAGRGIEAYKTIAPADQTFPQLGNLFEWGKKPELLDELVRMHRAAHPDDEWLDYFAAIVLIQRAEFDEAEKLLSRGHAKATDETTKAAYNRKRIANSVEAGATLAAYKNIPPANETFRSLAAALRDQEDWAELRKLIEHHRASQPDDPQFAVWDAELLWGTKDYEELVAAPTFAESKLAGLDEWQANTIREKILRGYLRLGRATDALRFATSVYETNGNANLMMLAHAANGNLNETIKYQDESSGQTSRNRPPYDDEDVGAMLSSKEFLPLREKHPRFLPYYFGEGSVTLLFQEPTGFDAAKIASRVTAFLKRDCDVSDLSSVDVDTVSRSYFLRLDDRDFCVTVGDDRYVPADSETIQFVESAALRQSLARHTAWLTVLGINSPNSAQAADSPNIRNIALALLDDNCLAISLSDNGRILENSPQTRELLTGDDAEKRAEAGEELWLYREFSADDDEQVSWRRRKTLMKQFAKAFMSRTDGQPFRIQIDIRAGDARERHWLSVDRVQHNTYGSYDFYSRFAKDSRLAPQFAEGEPVQVGQYQIVDWKYRDGDREVRGKELLKKSTSTSDATHESGNVE